MTKWHGQPCTAVVLVGGTLPGKGMVLSGRHWWAGPVAKRWTPTMLEGMGQSGWRCLTTCAWRLAPSWWMMSVDGEERWAAARECREKKKGTAWGRGLCNEVAGKGVVLLDEGGEVVGRPGGRTRCVYRLCSRTVRGWRRTRGVDGPCTLVQGRGGLCDKRESTAVAPNCRLESTASAEEGKEGMRHAYLMLRKTIGHAYVTAPRFSGLTHLATRLSRHEEDQLWPVQSSTNISSSIVNFTSIMSEWASLLASY